MWIWGFSADFLLYSSSQALSGRMGTVGEQTFSGRPGDAQLGSSQDSSRAVQGH